MKLRILALAVFLPFGSIALAAENEAQDPDTILAGLDGSGLMKQLQERQQKIEQLSTDERIALDTVRKEAMEDPAVKTALAARNAAARELAATLQANMLKNDPTLAPIFAKTEREGLGPR